MKKKNYRKIANDVIDLEIVALKKLRKSINNSFNQAVDTGAETVATGCSFCTIMMDDAMKVSGKENIMEVKDIAEIIGDSIE